MTKYPHLAQVSKRGIWRYRRSVPAKLRPIIGTREILMSFGTPVLEEALPQYHFIAADTERRLDLAQAEIDCREEDAAAEADGGSTIINDMIPQLVSGQHVDPQHVCDRHYRECQARERAFRYETTRRVSSDTAAFWRGDIIDLPVSQGEFYNLPQFAYLRGSGDGCKYVLAMAYRRRLEHRLTLLRTMLVTHDVEALAATFACCSECAPKIGLALAHTELRLIGDLLADDTALLPPPIALGRDNQAPQHRPVAPGDTAGTPLSRAVEDWIAAGSTGRSAWSPERRALCQRVLSDFIDICGDKAVGDYRKSDGREFVQLLRRLPANLDKRKASLGAERHNLRQIADIAETRGLIPQDDGNANKKIGIVHQCFRWIMTRYDECLASPVEGMKIAVRRNAKEEKDPFTTDQLNAMFAAPIFVGCESERHWNRPGKLVLRASAKFWVPLIALFSGMRSGEICQLTRSHIRQHENLHYFALTSDLRLKNVASTRSVPMHDMLIRCGFLQFVETCEGTLFSDLVQHASGRWSDAFGKHFARFLRSVGAKTDSTDFHSFRHNFIAAADASGVEFASRGLFLPRRNYQ